MKKEYFTRYVFDKGNIKELKVSRKEAMKDIRQILKEDKEFLKIMEKM